MNNFVSRAGEKLQFALQTFKIDVKDLICGDFGSSTGGFVDCLLQHGASKVYAVETGYGVLDWKLRNDPQRPSKRSRKIQIIIKEDAIEDYLNKSKPDRELYGITLKQLVCEWYNHFDPDNDSLTARSIPTEKWLISRAVLNTLTHSHDLNTI